MKHPSQTSSLWLAVLAFILIIAGCDDAGTEGAAGGMGTAMMTMPVTTDSDEARGHFMAGLYAQDMGRSIEARTHFEQATEADPGFALAYLALANTANSVEEFTTNLKKAEDAADGSSQEEQLMIEMTRKDFDGNVEAELATAQALTETAPESPRAWLMLAGIQAGLNNHADARTSLAKAIELAPDMAAAHMLAGNEYLFGTPKDLAEAERHMLKAVELAPNEANPHDMLGDVYRAQGQLEKARDAYTEASRHSGVDGSPYQQRGHVNSFLGDYDAARADYDKSISMARANQAPSYGVYRALVSVHAGDPAAAIDELKTLANSIDAMDIPEPIGLKTFALNNAATIALHHGMIEEAEAIIGDWTKLTRARAEQVGTEQFTRRREANIAYVEGVLAVKKGDYAKAEAKAGEIAGLVEPDANPRKMEPVHQLQGMIALAQKQYAKAAEHFRQGNPNSIYMKYHLAQALEGAGQTDEAMALYREVATWNFNSAGFALTRKAAMEKAGMTS